MRDRELDGLFRRLSAAGDRRLGESFTDGVMAALPKGGAAATGACGHRHALPALAAALVLCAASLCGLALERGRALEGPPPLVLFQSSGLEFNVGAP